LQGGTPPRPALAETTSSRSAATVLIVDDEPSIRFACRCALEFEGFRAVIEMMTEDSAGQFDPGLLLLFKRSDPRFEQIYMEMTD
jgi:hypothetical protein